MLLRCYVWNLYSSTRRHIPLSLSSVAVWSGMIRCVTPSASDCNHNYDRPNKPNSRTAESSQFSSSHHIHSSVSFHFVPISSLLIVYLSRPSSLALMWRVCLFHLSCSRLHNILCYSFVFDKYLLNNLFPRLSLSPPLSLSLCLIPAKADRQTNNNNNNPIPVVCSNVHVRESIYTRQTKWIEMKTKQKKIWRIDNKNFDTSWRSSAYGRRRGSTPKFHGTQTLQLNSLFVAVIASIVDSGATMHIENFRMEELLGKSGPVVRHNRKYHRNHVLTDEVIASFAVVVAKAMQRAFVFGHHGPWCVLCCGEEIYCQFV